MVIQTETHSDRGYNSSHLQSWNVQVDKKTVETHCTIAKTLFENSNRIQLSLFLDIPLGYSIPKSKINPNKMTDFARLRENFIWESKQ